MLFQACMTFFKHKRSYFEEYILKNQDVWVNMWTKTKTFLKI